MDLERELIANRRYPAYDLTVRPRKKKLDSRMLVKGMLCRIDELANVAP